ncbi:hypothetical protein SteCoe_14663 [Stentor coeruleus]|uniref:GH16 domain-containing protein n=1 Tax=Stentor coeruleus TaxID=5963 RepID=A0A1R2C5F3_9CILI|nr:hypothetical protein SteCoe_14663 [Stentor coeruleus]
MGCKNVCMSANNEKNSLNTNPDDGEIIPYEQNSNVEGQAENEEENPQLEIRIEFPNFIDSNAIQSVARGFLTRREIGPKVAKLQLDRKNDPANKYEHVEGNIDDFLSDELIRLEQNLSFFNIERAEHNISILERDPLKLENGNIYSGEWDKSGNIHGIGTMITREGCKIVGYFKDGQLNGKGRKIEADGCIFQGNFKDGILQGEGKVIRKDDALFEGTFKGGEVDGKGKEKWPDGVEYEGEYKNGLKHGKGKLKLNYGKYEGEFKNNKIHGKGCFIWENENIYNGDWKYNLMHGQGKFKWSDGRVYKGKWEKDTPNGEGTMKWPDGKIYSGGWSNGKYHGIGSLTFKNNKGEFQTKHGEWVDGVRTKWID